MYTFCCANLDEKSSKCDKYIKMDRELESWQQTQGYIVTGGGLITLNSSLYEDFLPSDLPHYLLQNNVSESTFRRWKQCNRRSFSIIGCWSRPIFAGGWQESSLHDTEAYNLQTPSLFIDMRFPLNRPTAQLTTRRGLEDCSILDLRLLARQHCFTGYSLPESLPAEKFPQDSSKFPVFTRHHIIDWNLHPQFPRNRPNRWWVEINDGGNNDDPRSFKEHSIIRNKETDLPVYFERWDRIRPYPHQRQKYFAARKVRKSGKERDAVLIVVGSHFALVLDRDMNSATSKFVTDAKLLTHLKQNCNGGGAFYVDYLLNSELHDMETIQSHIPLARAYLDLEGSYGLIQEQEVNSANHIVSNGWTIRRSTHPWREGTKLFSEGDNITFSFPSLAAGQIPTRMLWSTKEVTSSCSSIPQHKYGEWEVFECSFSREELHQIFPTPDSVPVPSYLSLFSRL